MKTYIKGIRRAAVILTTVMIAVLAMCPAAFALGEKRVGLLVVSEEGDTWDEAIPAVAVIKDDTTAVLADYESDGEEALIRFQSEKNMYDAEAKNDVFTITADKSDPTILKCDVGKKGDQVFICYFDDSLAYNEVESVLEDDADTYGAECALERVPDNINSVAAVINANGKCVGTVDEGESVMKAAAGSDGTDVVDVEVNGKKAGIVSTVINWVKENKELAIVIGAVILAVILALIVGIVAGNKRKKRNRDESVTPEEQYYGDTYGGGMDNGGYGAADGGYGMDNSVYGADNGGYGMDNGGYGAAGGGYGMDNGGYGADNGGYGMNGGGYGANDGYSETAPVVDGGGAGMRNPDVNVDINRGDILIVADGGDMDGRIYKFTGNEIIFGRAKNATVRYRAEAKGVSRNHCKLYMKNGQLMLMDMGSSYGTYVDGMGKLSENMPVPINRGDSFCVGDSRNKFMIK